MERFTEEQTKESVKFAEFYIDLVENHFNTFSYYVADNALLDWFGKTVKGVNKISVFLKENLANVKHIFPKIEPCSSIGYREIHVVNYDPAERTPEFTTIKLGDDEEKTPPSMLTSPPGGSKKRELGQGDGLHNCCSSPMKRSRLAVNVTTEGEPRTPPKINHITSNGHLEFYRKSSKKYQRETHWSRPCKFQVAFSNSSTGYMIHLIIYQGNMKCRRNLMNDFDSVDAEEK